MENNNPTATADGKYNPTAMENKIILQQQPVGK